MSKIVEHKIISKVSSMSEKENSSNIRQFNDFFSINYTFNVNITPIDNKEIPTYQEFINSIPLPFKMANDIITLDQSALKPLQALSSIAGQLVNYLNHQTKKIDLLISYVLSQLDDKQIRFQGIKFGGGGIVFKNNATFNLGEILELKIFLIEENCAIYCYGEIIEINQEDNEFHHKVIFHHIREEDREILVRTSLHQQSKQLQLLAQQRKHED